MAIGSHSRFTLRQDLLTVLNFTLYLPHKYLSQLNLFNSLSNV